MTTWESTWAKLFCHLVFKMVIDKLFYQYFCSRTHTITCIIIVSVEWWFHTWEIEIDDYQYGIPTEYPYVSFIPHFSATRMYNRIKKSQRRKLIDIDKLVKYLQPMQKIYFVSVTILCIDRGTTTLIDICKWLNFPWWEK